MGKPQRIRLVCPALVTVGARRNQIRIGVLAAAAHRQKMLDCEMLIHLSTIHARSAGFRKHRVPQQCSLPFPFTSLAGRRLLRRDNRRQTQVGLSGVGRQRIQPAEVCWFQKVLVKHHPPVSVVELEV